MLVLSFTYCPVDKILHEEKRGGYSGHGYDKGDISCDDGDERRNISCDNGDLRGDIRVDDGRREYRSKDNIQFSSRNIGETVGGNWIGRYRSQTAHSSPNNPGDHGRLLHITGSSCHVDDNIYEN